jgi:hypothetical protein
MVGPYKRSLLIDLRTFRCLSKYLFREKVQWYFKKKCSENMYAVENIDSKPNVKGFVKYK